jgi:hypothetical protein
MVLSYLSVSPAVKREPSLTVVIAGGSVTRESEGSVALERISAQI